MVAQHHLKTTEGKMKGTKEKGHHFPFFVENSREDKGAIRFFYTSTSFLRHSFVLQFIFLHIQLYKCLLQM